MTNITTAIVQASQQPNGLDTTKLTGYTARDAGYQVQKMCKEGQLHKAKLSHRVVRYFDTAERAAAYIRKHGPYSGETRADKKKKEAEARIADGPAIVPKNVKRTVLENYPPHRYWIDPASVPMFRYGSKT